MSVESRYVLKFRLCGVNAPAVKIQTLVDLQKCCDVQELIGELCNQLGCPNIAQLELTDNSGNTIESLGMLMQAQGEVNLIINPLVKPSQMSAAEDHAYLKVLQKKQERYTNLYGNILGKQINYRELKALKVKQKRGRHNRPRQIKEPQFDDNVNLMTQQSNGIGVTTVEFGADYESMLHNQSLQQDAVFNAKYYTEKLKQITTQSRFVLVTQVLALLGSEGFVQCQEAHRSQEIVRFVSGAKVVEFSKDKESFRVPLIRF